MKFLYNEDANQLIIDHETTMFRRYTEYIYGFSMQFAQYDCDLKVELLWNNSFGRELFGPFCDKRLPFKRGYECYVACEVQKDGETVCVKSTDGEVDYYILSAVWAISAINNFFFKPHVYLYSDICEAEEDIEGFLSTLKEATENNKDSLFTQKISREPDPELRL